MTHQIVQGILKFQESSCNCTIFDNQIVLAPGSVLENFIRSSKSTEVLESLMKNEPILLPEGKTSFTVKYRDKKSDLRSFHVCEVKLLTTVFCADLFTLLESFIPEFLDNISQYLKSYFLVLRIGSEKVSVENRFLYFFRESQRNRKLQILDDVLTVSTPFNNEAFYSTVHLAKVANVKNGMLFVMSNSMPKDCEGCPVFNSKLKLIGLILFTTLKSKEENFNLTCAVSFEAILKSYLKNQGILETLKTPTKRVPHYLEKSILKVHGRNLQGTGVMVNVQNKPYILTCSHVLDNFKRGDFIKCQYIEGVFKAKLIWRNEKYEEPYDLAILEPEIVLPHFYYSEISSSCYVGQEVLAAGFPFYSSEDEFNPSVYSGHITRHNQFILQHDATVQSGQSGGPLFDGSGKVLGICVSNLKCDNDIYPQMCLSIPLSIVGRKLQAFNKSRDIKDLDELGSVSDDVRQSWNVEAKL
ncbi:TYSND1 family protein [Megaselia abdita]